MKTFILLFTLTYFSQLTKAYQIQAIAPIYIDDPYKGRASVLGFFFKLDFVLNS